MSFSLAQSEVQFDGLTLEGQIAQFGSISSTLRAVPDKRRELRKRINDYTPSLVAALNEFIREAQATLAPEYKGIVIMADNLDRIVERQEAGKPSNYDEIYLNRSEILRGLDCHVIYTVRSQWCTPNGRPGSKTTTTSPMCCRW